MMNILVTGATGFIGRSVCADLIERGHIVRGSSRNNACDVSEARKCFQVGDINGTTDWQQALAGIDAVIHLAARVHIMKDPASDPLEAFRQVNVLGTERLARMAVKAGVKRFIFVSSIKVNGESSDQPYTEKDIPRPEDAYGISKREAEEVLARVAVETGLQTVILRLPLVYGPGVKANFRNLIRIAGTGLPLPFRGIRNKRSFIYIGNLADAIAACVTHPLAAGETFLVSDGEDVSTPELIRMIARAMNRTALLFPLPSGLLKALGVLLGQGAAMEKLIGSLRVDDSKIRDLLGWKPPFTLEEGIAETVKEL